MVDVVDDNKKPIISFKALDRQEVNESKVPFKYARKERQLKLNFGKSIDPEQSQERDSERSQRSLVLNLSRSDLYKITFPSAVVVNIYPSLDEYGNTILANDPRYFTIKPVSVTLQVSNRHPFPLSRFTNSDLQDYITNTFGKYILREVHPSKASHDEHFKGLQDVAFTHNVLLEGNEMTGRDDLNKRAFNVYGARVYDHELNYINKKLEILGFKPIKKENALFRTEKNINTVPYNIFELGEV
jgi:hypothetical protein